MRRAWALPQSVSLDLKAQPWTQGTLGIESLPLSLPRSQRRARSVTGTASHREPASTESSLRAFISPCNMHAEIHWYFVAGGPTKGGTDQPGVGTQALVSASSQGGTSPARCRWTRTPELCTPDDTLARSLQGGGWSPRLSKYSQFPGTFRSSNFF